MQTTTRPQTLLERLRREVEQAVSLGTMTRSDWDYLAKLQDHLAWMEKRQAEREIPHG